MGVNKIWQKIRTEIVESITCDVCGEDTFSFCASEYAQLVANWGYGSNRDGENICLYFCETCFGMIENFIKEMKEKDSFLFLQKNI